MNVDGFHTRAVIYFVAWIAISWLLSLSSPNEDPQADSPRARRLQRTSALGFIVYGLTITLAAVDWVMSLEPEWYSTMYGVLYMGGQAVSGMSFALVAVLLLGQFEPWSRTVTRRRRNDLGNLLLTFVMFWAYVAFMQYLVIWSGNLPEENVWYLRRSQAWLGIPGDKSDGFTFRRAVPIAVVAESKASRRPGFFALPYCCW